MTTAVLNATSAKQQSDIKNWEEVVEACEHTVCLEQMSPKPHVSKHCDNCDKDQNLWLCLTCGNVGCARRQYDGSGGNNHGIDHYDTTKHPVSCKLGTITAEGTAGIPFLDMVDFNSQDIYCYVCDEMRVDPYLSAHLGNFGIQIEAQQKTEKSMAELQLEQNLKFEFNMVSEDGKTLPTIFGPGLTGIKNIGNSCYMASVLQSVSSLPFFQKYAAAHDPKQCQNLAPGKCLECQLHKLAHGLSSGKFSKPSKRAAASNSDGSTPFQDGIPPTMFKSLTCKDHEEFKSARQQDAYEYLQFLLEFLDKNTSTKPSLDFEMTLSHRVECSQCHYVGYNREPTSSLNLRVNGAAGFKEEDFVSFQTCLNTFSTDAIIDDFNCSQCNKKVVATRRTRIMRSPKYLTCYIQRFVLENWVPRKLVTPLIVESESLDLSSLKVTGEPAPGERLFPEAATPAKDPADGVSADDIRNLMAMGFSRNRSIRALKATDNGGVEVAMEWIFARIDDSSLDEPIAAEASSKPDESVNEEAVLSLMDMGFNKPQAKKALRLNKGNPEAAVEWLFSNSGDPGDVDAAPSANTSSAQPALPDYGTKYQLHAIISHKGPSVHCGHYVAFVKHPTSGWALFNDEKVVQVPAEGVTGDGAIEGAKQGYVLIYKASSE